jgi:hypothetical protein
MANSVNWLFDDFLLLFNLHVSFLLFFYFWNVGLSSFCHALFLSLFSVFFILLSVCCLPSVHFPPSVHCPPGCALVVCSLAFLLLPCTFPILRIFPQNCIKTAKLFPISPSRFLHTLQIYAMTFASSFSLYECSSSLDLWWFWVTPIGHIGPTSMSLLIMLIISHTPKKSKIH